ncbi:MAG: 4Fe-4S binding protein [Clostridia bacterium]|nr:4Fe-4S binding protein [Clostridia bacterium]
MIKVDAKTCTGCKLCVRECPTGAIALQDGVAVVGEGCAECGLCSKLCPHGAVQRQTDERGRVKCTLCPVECNIAPGYWGACRRYRNVDGRLLRDAPLVIPAEPRIETERKLPPLITGIGAGTTAPCFAPAPYIVEGEVDGVDVVTVVSEVPLSYSGVKVKIDTNRYLGEEGAKVRRDGRTIGLVTTEEYGAKMLSLGGVNILHGKSGSTAARTIVDLAARRPVEVAIEKGARVVLQLGQPPIIDGRQDEKMRIGCGSATTAMFAPLFKEIADEVIILDPEITGLFSEHQAGRAVGMTWSGVVPVGRKSTIGRYFGEAGPGLGGTKITRAREAIAAIDPEVARPGMRILVTDTTGSTRAMFRLLPGGELEEIELDTKAQAVLDLIRENCEPARVSALYVAGLGGSSRAGVVRYPIKLTEAVHRGLVRLTMGGAPVWLFPGGGITVAVDLEKLPPGAITWVPTPATVAPVEYTMPREVYAAIEGHLGQVRRLEDVLQEREVRYLTQDFRQL